MSWKRNMPARRSWKKQREWDTGGTRGQVPCPIYELEDTS